MPDNNNNNQGQNNGQDMKKDNQWSSMDEGRAQENQNMGAQGAQGQAGGMAQQDDDEDEA